MSTRANIILKDGKNKLFFYRHSDGYPEGTEPTLKVLSRLIKSGQLRNNLSQCAGWLIIIGAIEYQTVDPALFSEHGKGLVEMDGDKIESQLNSFVPDGWKIGAYEPTTGIHGDVEYIYTFDIPSGEYKIKNRHND